MQLVVLDIANLISFMISFGIAMMHSNVPSHENMGIEAFTLSKLLDHVWTYTMLQLCYRNVIPTIPVKSVRGECMESQNK